MSYVPEEKYAHGKTDGDLAAPEGYWLIHQAKNNLLDPRRIKKTVLMYKIH